MTTYTVLILSSIKGQSLFIGKTTGTFLLQPATQSSKRLCSCFKNRGKECSICIEDALNILSSLNKPLKSQLDLMGK